MGCGCGLHPGGLCDKQCQQEEEALVLPFPEPDDLFRLYRREWVQVYRSVAVSTAGRDEVEAHFMAKYKGRVRGDDVEFSKIPGTSILKLRLWNLKGEYKTEAYALQVVQGMGWSDVRVVKRNSREDYALREYGAKMLPKEE